VQAIGGANEKIEGFFAVCKAKGLTGSQGVIIPASNVKHLMLRDEVVEAVRDKKFHIYSVSNIDEGISLLTGKEAGEKMDDGFYPEDTVNWAVQQKVWELAAKVRAFSSNEEESEDKNSN
jgi:predicted ATP-dependent protease